MMGDNTDTTDMGYISETMPDYGPSWAMILVAAWLMFVSMAILIYKTGGY